MLQLKIVRESPYWVLVDKPAGFHTHPPEDKNIRVNPRRNGLAILERQLGQILFPMHRLDRAASGLLLYSRNREHNGMMQKQFAESTVEKTYFVVARGELKGSCEFLAPLRSEAGGELAATTKGEASFSFTLPLPHPRGGDRRFTVLEVRPETGRFHQIRRHFAQAGFPLLGDSRHGDRKLNREFAALTGCDQLFLRCMSMTFVCPENEARIQTKARWSREWHRLFEIAGACALTASPFQAPQRLS